MWRYLSAYLGAAGAIAVLDAIWLTATNAGLYRAILGPILTPGFRLVPALLFYLVYLVGVVVFAVAPALRVRRWRAAAINGALLGLVAYATYDLTNEATLAVWQIKLTVIDLCWGTFLTTVGACAGYAAAGAGRRA